MTLKREKQLGRRKSQERSLSRKEFSTGWKREGSATQITYDSAPISRDPSRRETGGSNDRPETARSRDPPRETPPLIHTGAMPSSLYLPSIITPMPARADDKRRRFVP